MIDDLLLQNSFLFQSASNNLQYQESEKGKKVVDPPPPPPFVREPTLLGDTFHFISPIFIPKALSQIQKVDPPYKKGVVGGRWGGW